MSANHGLSRREVLCLAGASALTAAGSVFASSAKPFRVIDTHVHLFNSAIQGQNGGPKYMPESTVEATLAQMDAGGVDRAFLIGYNAEDIASEIRSRGENPTTMLPVISRRYQVAAWKAHPQRFWFFPGYTNPLHEDLIDDYERLFDAGASGVKLLPLFHGLLPDSPAFRPVYELCRRRKKPIIIDLSWWYLGGEIGHGYNETPARQKTAQSWTSYAEYAKTLDPIFYEYSTVPFSLAHCGTAKKREDYAHIFAMIARHPNVSCDLAMIMDYSTKFMEELTKAVGAGKVMYGTDAPYWWKGPDSYRTASTRWTLIADDCPFLTDAEKQAILAGNAERFVKNQLPKAS